MVVASGIMMYILHFTNHADYEPEASVSHRHGPLLTQLDVGVAPVAEEAHPSNA